MANANLHSGRDWHRVQIIDGTYHPLEAPEHPKARSMFELWQACRRGDDLPMRDDFDFEELGARGLLGHVFVLEPLDGGRDWHYRLLGSEILWLFGRDLTNVPFREAYVDSEAEHRIALSNKAAQERQPIFLKGRYRSSLRSGTVETMSLPVWNRDGDDIWLIGASFDVS